MLAEISSITWTTTPRLCAAMRQCTTSKWVPSTLFFLASQRGLSWFSGQEFGGQTGKLLPIRDCQGARVVHVKEWGDICIKVLDGDQIFCLYIYNCSTCTCYLMLTTLWTCTPATTSSPQRDTFFRSRTGSQFVYSPFLVMLVTPKGKY